MEDVGSRVEDVGSMVEDVGSMVEDVGSRVEVVFIEALFSLCWYSFLSFLSCRFLPFPLSLLVALHYHTAYELQ
jgi:hypothetical protein